MSIDRSMLKQMMHSPVRNYIIPGVTSWLIGESSPHGTMRLFECSRDHQEEVTPHSHRFDFQCWVLTGSVRNRVWQGMSYEGDLFTQTNLIYQGECGKYERVHIGTARYTFRDATYGQDEWYSMKAEQIHSIHFARGTEVLFFEGPNRRDHSVILEPFVDGETVPTFKVESWMFKKAGAAEIIGEPK